MVSIYRLIALWAWAGAMSIGSAFAAKAMPAEPIRAAPDQTHAPHMEPPSTAPIRLPRESPEVLRVSPLADPWAVAEVERLKSLALRSDLGPRGSRTQAQRKRSAAEAAWWLGLIYFHGTGVSQSPIQARQWFERAQALGHPLAPAGLAVCEIDGCVGPPDPQAARPWIGQLRRTSAPRAFFLEWLVDYRTSPIDLAPAIEPGASATATLPARDLLERAARAGDPHARIELGLDFASRHQWSEALAQFQRASATSAVAASNAAAVRAIIEENTRTTPGDTGRARQLLQEAKRQHRGEGVPANYAEALRLYRLAEAAGSTEAGRMLALISSRPAVGGGVNIEWMRQLTYVDLSQALPTLVNPVSGHRLQREPSPLFDWLPKAWQDKTGTGLR